MGTTIENRLRRLWGSSWHRARRAGAPALLARWREELDVVLDEALAQAQEQERVEEEEVVAPRILRDDDAG